jgi:hypothetical protein
MAGGWKKLRPGYGLTNPFLTAKFPALAAKRILVSDGQMVR